MQYLILVPSWNKDERKLFPRVWFVRIHRFHCDPKSQRWLQSWDGQIHRWVEHNRQSLEPKTTRKSMFNMISIKGLQTVRCLEWRLHNHVQKVRPISVTLSMEILPNMRFLWLWRHKKSNKKPKIMLPTAFSLQNDNR